MAMKFKDLLEAAPGKKSPGIVVSPRDSDRVLTSQEISQLTVQELEEYSIRVMGSSTRVMRGPEGYFAFYEGMKVTDFIPAEREAHVFLRQAYETAFKRRERFC